MPMSRDGKDDMFWDQPFDAEAMKKWCWDTWRVVPRPMWPEINWGGRRIESASNIVFSNGKLGPWSGGGILEVGAARHRIGRSSADNRSWLSFDSNAATLCHAVRAGH